MQSNSKEEKAKHTSKDLLLVGGGHTHVLFLKQLSMNPIPELRVTLLSDPVNTPYSGMLPGFIAGLYDESDFHIDLLGLTQSMGVNFVLGRAVNINSVTRTVDVNTGQVLHYDFLSIDVGSQPASANQLFDKKNPPHAHQVIPVKPIANLVKELEKLKRIATEKPILIVGSGAAGVEIAFAVVRFLATHGLSNPVKIISRQNAFFELGSKGVSRKLVKLAQNKGIEIVLNADIISMSNRVIKDSLGREFEYETLFWCTGSSAPSWLKQTDLPLSESGFIETESTLQIKQRPGHFAVGDIADLIDNPVPKAGVYAVREAPVLYENVKATVKKQRLSEFKPQRDFLSLLSIGDGTAVGHKFGLSFQGRWVWKLKDWIDRKFMDQFKHIDSIDDEKNDSNRAASPGMRCQGCGGKVGELQLNQILSKYKLDQAEDAARIEGADMWQSVDMMTAFTADLFLFGKIVTEHALGDIWAMGADVDTVQLIIAIQDNHPRLIQRDIEYLMDGVQQVLKHHGIKLIGGHTYIADQTQLGVIVNSVANQSIDSLYYTSPLRVLNQNNQQNEKLDLVLTKPLGVGVVLAANMQASCPGAVYANTLSWMQSTNRPYLESARRAHAKGMTDVTGFGLLGHLKHMVNDHWNAYLDLDSVPILKGVNALLDKGIVSSIWSDNVRATSDFIHSDYDLKKLSILFDPQTNGGLLIAVPDAKVFMEQLNEQSENQAATLDAGHEVSQKSDLAVRIGEIRPGTGMIEIR